MYKDAAAQSPESNPSYMRPLNLPEIASTPHACLDLLLEEHATDCLRRY